MYELRRIQHGDRPVTGQGNKEAVEQFFTEQRRETPEQARPENVVIEVNALVERRPVSSALQSARFRRSLENALRDAMPGGRSRQQPVQTRSHVPVVTPTTSASSVSLTSQNAVRPRNTMETVQEERQSTTR